MIRPLAAALGRFLRAYAWDLLAAGSLATVAAGVSWLWHPGAGLCTLGAGGLAVAVLGASLHRKAEG
jgi:hypothetical protein